MLMKQKPTKKGLYFIVDSEVNKILQQVGYHPLYLNDNKFYYRKDKEVGEFLRKEGLTFEI